MNEFLTQLKTDRKLQAITGATLLVLMVGLVALLPSNDELEPGESAVPDFLNQSLVLDQDATPGEVVPDFLSGAEVVLPAPAVEQVPELGEMADSDAFYGVDEVEVAEDMEAYFDTPLLEETLDLAESVEQPQEVAHPKPSAEETAVPVVTDSTDITLQELAEIARKTALTKAKVEHKRAEKELKALEAELEGTTGIAIPNLPPAAFDPQSFMNMPFIEDPAMPVSHGSNAGDYVLTSIHGRKGALVAEISHNGRIYNAKIGQKIGSATIKKIHEDYVVMNSGKSDFEVALTK